jgi:cellulose synthase operon protein C
VKNKYHTIATICCAAIILIRIVPASACGPYFPEHLVRYRLRTLNVLPSGTFALESRYLIAPPSRKLFTCDKPQHDRSIKQNFIDSAKNVFPWLPANLHDITETARKAASAQQAAVAGATLPSEVRLFICGTVEFAAVFHRDSIPDSLRTKCLQTALSYYDSVMALPPKERGHLAVRAAYMRAKCLLSLKQPDSAAIAFREVRKLVISGSPDPYALGLSSLGDEAKIFLDQGRYVEAIHRYAQQAACGTDSASSWISSSGTISLRQIGDLISANDSLMKSSIGDTVVQRLFCAIAYCRNGGYQDFCSEKRSAWWNKLLESGLTSKMKGSEMLAAGAYREGCFKAAKRLARNGTTGLHWWVRAKLYLRAGNFDSAAIAYARASELFTKQKSRSVDRSWFGDVGEAPIWTRPVCEAATLEVCRGNFMSALRTFFEGGPYYWMDAAYLAERVLSVDELKSFVDSVAPQNSFHGEQYQRSAPDNVPLAIRSLLARRLMREERGDEALAYFDDTVLNRTAAEYQERVSRVIDNAPIEKARNLFALAKLTRKRGMELMGYELDPDWTCEHGNYDQSVGGDYSCYGDSARYHNLFKLQARYFTKEEKIRVKETEAKPNKRFHYRYRAVELALQASDLVPAKSQAFSTILSNAWVWLLGKDQATCDMIFSRWKKRHPRYNFNCYDEPDFDEAEKMVLKTKFSDK